MRCLSFRDKEAYLIRWFRRVRRSLGEQSYVPEELFDREYKKLFGRWPSFYSWGHFYRDHGCVGLTVRTGLK